MAGSAERVFPGAPATIGRGLIASSFQYYLDGNDHLRIEQLFIGSNMVPAATPRLFATGRLYRPDTGDIQVFEYNNLRGSQLGTWESVDHRLEAGALLNLRLWTDDTDVRYGQLFGRAQIVRGGGAQGSVVGTLLQGFVSKNSDLGWPGSPLAGLHESLGVVDEREWTVLPAPLRAESLVGVGMRHELVAGSIDVQCSGVAGTRTVAIRAVRGTGNVIYAGIGALGLTAGQAANYHFGAGLSPSDLETSGLRHLAWPTGLHLTDGDQIEFNVFGADVGDVLTPGSLLVRMWRDR